MGRPTHCTPELAQQMGDLIREYGFVKTVCMKVGLAPQRHYEWIEKGEADLDAGDDSSPYAVYADTIKRAVADFQLANLDAIKSGDKAWQSRSWLNERSDPDQFGQKSRMEHSGSVSTGTAPIATPSERDERLRAMGITPPGPH